MIAGGVYGNSFRESDDHKNIVVILSQSSKPIMGSAEFPCRAIDVWENRKTSYYTYRSDIAVKELASLAGEVRNAVFVGCSKGGYGALLWGNLFAKSNPRVTVTSVVFSPQTQLHPVNASIKFPSYINFMARAKDNPKLETWLIKRGVLPQPPENFSARVFYPELQSDDRAEAERLIGCPHVDLHPLRLSCHTTILPFTADMTDEQTARKKVGSLFKAAQKEPDLASYLDSIGFEVLVSEYMALGALPTVPDIVSQIIQKSKPTENTSRDQLGFLTGLFKRARRI